MFPEARVYDPGVVGDASECKASKVREGLIFIRSPEFSGWAIKCKSTIQIPVGTK